MQRVGHGALIKALRPARPYSTNSNSLPLISIQNGAFYLSHPSSGLDNDALNPKMFSDLNFSLPSNPSEKPHWAIVGPSNSGKTTLLNVLRGKYICRPPLARSYPYLASDGVERSHRSSAKAIRYVGFDGDRGGMGKDGARGAYMSARYESRKQEEDFTVLDYLQGNTDLNPAEKPTGKALDTSGLERVSKNLKLEPLLEMPMGNLSNGQIRRTRIGKALLENPLVLLLDEPFMGLDPPTSASLTPLLGGLADSVKPRIILALRPQDHLPSWITHLIRLGPNLQIQSQGKRGDLEDPASTSMATRVLSQGAQKSHVIHPGLPEILSRSSRFPTGEKDISRDGLRAFGKKPDVSYRDAIVDMRDIHVRYGEREVLGNWKVRDEATGKDRSGFWWQVTRGDRWGVFGPNGSGKTTLISLICSDHPLSYSLPIRIFDRSRLPEPGVPGISIFDIQARIGQSSPEVHAFFPRNLSIRQVIENAWADTFLGTPRLKYENDVAVDSCLRWFEAELNPGFDPENTPTRRFQKKDYAVFRDTDWADNVRFGESPFSAQRVALFLRAIVKKPDLVVLDEAFSGMDEYVRDKCMLFLTWGETHTLAIREGDSPQRRVVKPTRQNMYQAAMFGGLQPDQTLICVSHVREEVPGTVRNWVSLPETGTGQPARFGEFRVPLDLDKTQWNEIWDVQE